ncbi:MAG: hypothetical protein M3P11_06335 [Actinomycetota bacterium]|nr:hypothetical protein [Actinomycetota bacterium]
MQPEGSFRTKKNPDGSLDVWAPGWRLGIRFAPFMPLVLAAGFMISSLPGLVRASFSIVLLGCAFLLQRLTTIGIVLTRDEVRLVGIFRATRTPWAQVSGFVGERDAHEGRPALLLDSGERLKAPGALGVEAMDAFWEGDADSAIDELNRIVRTFREDESPAEVSAGGTLAKPVVDVVDDREIAVARLAKIVPLRQSADDLASVPREEELASVIDVGVAADRRLVAVHEVATGPAPIARPEGSAPRSKEREIPAYVLAAAEQRGPYVSSGAARLAAWKEAHEDMTSLEEEGRRGSRRRSKALRSGR